MNQWVAILAPICNGIQLIPQLYKTFTTRQVRDLSLASIGLLLLTNLLWLLHGYYIQDVSLLLAGCFSMTVNLLLLAGYLRFKYLSKGS
jgi:uncharacterized protein with PQ loop repeat